MLSSLEIKNFKGIKSGTISDLAQVNILVGRNNSGKSTILDALLLMRCAFAKTDYLHQDGVQQVLKRKIPREQSNNLELAYFLNAQKPITIRARLLDVKFAVAQEWTVGGGSFIRVSLIQELPGNVKKSLGYDPPGNHVDHASDTPGWKELADEVGDKNARFIATTHLIDSSSIRILALERFWDRMVIGRRQDLGLRDMINDIYKLNIDGFNFVPFGGHNRLVALLPESGVAVDWLGDGLRYALNILALGMLLEGTILMVEELETHQHPESLKLLTQTLFELARKQNLQLFLTTHSWELMTYALEAAEEKGVGLAMHHLDLDREGNLHARAIGEPDARLLMDIGHDPRRIYKYTGVE